MNLNPTKSIQNYKQAIQMDNNNLDLIYRLGMILYKQDYLNINFDENNVIHFKLNNIDELE